jgi:small ligand-binding sensory domain FIST
MPFAAALSTDPISTQALGEAVTRALADLGPGPAPDLAVLFFSTHHAGQAEDLAEQAVERLGTPALIGCVAEGVIGNEREVEQGPALAVWLGRWPRGVSVEPFALELERTADGPSLFGWPDALLGTGDLRPDAQRDLFGPARMAVLLLGDPYTFDPELFLRRMNEDARGVPVLGGMASGVKTAGQCRLIQGGRVLRQGAVGALLQGNVGLRGIVSQGCRPIGRHMVITRAEGNVILELGGRKPLEQLQELWQSLSASEQRLFQRGLHIGRVLNEYQEEFQRGDFLVRNVLGLDRASGALVITDQVRVGQTVQFHVRDGDSADEDLHALLQMDLSAHAKKPAAGLLFSCNGRGTRLFPRPDHDAAAVRQEAGSIPLAGFFAQGELGPVGGQNFIHGFTASLALFEE